MTEILRNEIFPKSCRIAFFQVIVRAGSIDFGKATGYNATAGPPHLEQPGDDRHGHYRRKPTAAGEVQDHDRDRPVGNFDG
jgi:hypothetical protein